MINYPMFKQKVTLLKEFNISLVDITVFLRPEFTSLQEL